MKYFPVVSLPCIMKWSGLQDLLIRLLVIFSYLKLQVFVTPPLDIQDEQNQIQVEFENLRENPGVIHNGVGIKVKIDEFAFKNTAGMLNKNCRNSSLRLFVETAVMQICRKFIEEHPCGIMISVKVLCNFTEITSSHGVPLYICCIFANQIFWRTPMGDCSWIFIVVKQT